MHKRDFKEKAYGRWLVVIDEDDTERFYTEKDAREYQQMLEVNGIPAFVVEEED